MGFPLSHVRLRTPITFSWCPHGVTSLVAGEPIPNTHPEVKCPALYLDTDLRAVVVGDELIPFDGALVMSARRARAAKGAAQ